MPATAAFDAFLSERGLDATRDEPLGPHTTWKVGGTADWLVRPRDERELADVVHGARECDLPWRVLGSGANLLVTDDGARGVVLQLSRMRRRDGLHVEAGYSLPRLARETADAGLSGLECLAGVPAAVGGAIAMNAGGRHGEIAGAVAYVDVLTPDGGVRRMTRDEVPFRYRSWGLAPGHIAVAAGFRLSRDDRARARFDEVLADKKATQPLGSHNAGCVFKNPPGGRAGKMIDDAGLKGTRVGPAHVSSKHANFIINDGGARAGDVLRVIDVVRDRVRALFSVQLELEVLVW